MSEELIVQQCSPTLAGLKTGSIFNCPFRSRKDLWKEIRLLNTRLKPKGLRVIPLRISAHNAMIYIYRPERLSKDLADSKAACILEDCGYTGRTVPGCISLLMERLRVGEDFPHEIGLFLGYPPEDVSGFIENKALKSKATGHWKVYGDEKKAMKTFARFKKCTKVYTDRRAHGVSIERLAVAG